MDIVCFDRLIFQAFEKPLGANVSTWDLWKALDHYDFDIFKENASIIREYASSASDSYAWPYYIAPTNQVTATPDKLNIGEWLEATKIFFSELSFDWASIGDWSYYILTTALLFSLVGYRFHSWTIADSYKTTNVKARPAANWNEPRALPMLGLRHEEVVILTILWYMTNYVKWNAQLMNLMVIGFFLLYIYCCLTIRKRDNIMEHYRRVRAAALANDKNPIRPRI